MTARDDFLPSCDLQMLKTRADLLQRTRAFFDQAGFVEVQTPLLSQDTMVDRHIEPIRVECDDQVRYLQTSPEFAMKRLIAAGIEAIYQIGPVFRARERGKRHNQEFTMLEWYRAGDSVGDAVDFTGRLACSLLQRTGYRVITYEDAFESALEINPFQVNEQDLCQTIRDHRVSAPENLQWLDRDELLDILLTECIQPQLGLEQPALLCEYPATQAALAQKRTDKPDRAERFELYVDGYELANGYGELLDPQEMLARHQAVNEKRRKDGNSKLPEMSYLLKAMEYGLPPCSGVALGFDRLMMVATKADTIDDVIAFPFERA